MNFKEWFLANEANLVQGFQQQNQGNSPMGLGKAAAMAGMKAAVGAVPVAGSVANFIWDMVDHIKKGQSNPQTVRQVLQLMQQKDQSRTPSNFFDLDDRISDTLSDAAKLSVAQKILQIVNSSDPQQIPGDLGSRVGRDHLLQVANSVQ